MKLILLPVVLAVVGLANGAGYNGPTNPAGLELIKYYEGWYPNFYTDPVGIRTIGYGHACHVWDCSVPLNGRYNVPLTLANGQSLLADDLVNGNYETCVRNYNTYTGLNADMYSALVSFTFNLGCGSYQSSTLRTLLNAGNTLGASLEFRKWINAGGSPLLGLARRRESERVLFCQSGGCPTSCKGRVNADTLNCRKDPNTSAFVVASYANGATLDIFERVTGTVVNGNPNWFLVGPGYVSAVYVDITAGGGGWCATTLNETSTDV
jgi:GH24 family phage-related lysozyme (muramidase)